MKHVENIKDLEPKVRRLVVMEALLRRIALVNKPFVLKGSLLTRQYLEDPELRAVSDLDLLYAGKIEDTEHACKTFTAWMIQVTELDLDDGIVFKSFNDDDYWRYIDYAMADDFPTVNTEVEYYFKGEPRRENQYYELDLDISFNLEMEVEPVALQYKPVFGDSFIFPYSAPLALQVAWKLHQTIVRPRFKDLVDLNYLLSHPAYDKRALQDTLQALVNECSLDPNITSTHIKRVLVNDLHHTYSLLKNDYDLRTYEGAEGKEVYFCRVVDGLREKMDLCGMNRYAFADLPSPTLKK
ncbi:nucleotidyl transferase AbiEii/AbiGii toxin family protein [Paenibacillus sp. 481]|uniref:nucleotidyl transferase AbiEii/AbiGii toxin family protein n=1 Tax=Paenibacillus sp. 481 TaxID=2835869 RepID=UPI001E55FB93|nr:nucleotidyl transferase AbiEii/AbiGii toxin family protein [Paenibacillus sp. 481]UHA75192.1 nucleotidyl transferase AbiEii/AbiGii toxin family protein [Paenibacillus sp. 481]